VSVDQTVVIIGAGDHGRGTLEILREAGRHGSSCEVIGFLDDSPQKGGVTVGGLPVLGGLDWIDSERVAQISYLIGIADARIKQQIARRLEDKPLQFISAIHPSAIVANGVRIAAGAIINAGVAIAYDTLIGEHTTVNLNATIGHDCLIGPYSTVAPGANIAGRVRLIEGCEVGLNAAVTPGVEIGAWSRVGPGSIVLKDVPPGQVVFGNPARIVPGHSTVHNRTA
jgi:sugar O-acyltransferase (sialic acid O-acetyltransferase NeuD family)